MQKGYLVEARLTKLGDRDHIVTGLYAVGDNSAGLAEERLVRFLSGMKGGADDGITAHAVREMSADEVAQLDLRPTQIRQRT